MRKVVETGFALDRDYSNRSFVRTSLDFLVQKGLPPVPDLRESDGLLDWFLFCDWPHKTSENLKTGWREVFDRECQINGCMCRWGRYRGCRTLSLSRDLRGWRAFNLEGRVGQIGAGSALLVVYYIIFWLFWCTPACKAFASRTQYSGDLAFLFSMNQISCRVGVLGQVE